MAFDVRDAITKKKKDEENQTIATSGGFDVRNAISQREVLSGKQNNSYNNAVSSYNNLSSLNNRNTQQKVDAFKDFESIVKTSNENQKALDEAMKQNFVASQYLKNNASALDQLYGEGYSSQALKNLDSMRRSTLGTQDAVKAEADYRNQFASPELYKAALERTDRLNNYETLSQNPDYAQNSKFVSTYNPLNEKQNQVTGKLYNTGFGDINYDYINDSARAESYKMMNGGGDEWLRQMTDEQKANYNYLYATQGKNAAEQYIEDIQPDLFKEYRKAETEKAQAFADQNPVLSSVYSVAQKPFEAVSFAGNVIGKALGQELDPNNPMNSAVWENTGIRTQVANNIEEKLGEKWGKVGSWAYQVGMSMADSAVQMLGIKALSSLGDLTMLSSGARFNNALGKLPKGLQELVAPSVENAMLAVMGSEAAAETMLSMKDQGYDDSRVFTLGLVAGAAEYITERMGIDAFFDKGLLKQSISAYLLKNSLSEGTEEVMSDVINWVADNIYSLATGDETEFRNRVNGYIEQGMDAGKAEWQAIVDGAKTVGLDFLGGALSGGLMGGMGVAGSVAQSGISNLNTANAVRKAGEQSSLIQQGLEAAPSTKAYQLAQANQGNNMSLRQTAKQVGANRNAIEGERVMEQAAAFIQRGGNAQEAVDSVIGNKDAMQALGLGSNLSNKDLRSKETRGSVKTALEALASRNDALYSPLGSITQQNYKDLKTGDFSTRAAISAEAERVANPQTELRKELIRNFSNTLGKSGENVLNRLAENASDKNTTQFVKDFYTVYSAGLNSGGSVNDLNTFVSNLASQGKTLSLNSAQMQMAFLAGEADRSNNEIYSRNKGRNARISSEQGRSEGIRGRAEKTAKGRTSEELRAENKKYYGKIRGDLVSAKSVGIGGGTDTKGIKVIVDKDLTKADRKTKKNLEKQGYSVTMISGTAEITHADGTLGKVRGEYDAANKRIVLQVDNEHFTAEQIAKHELYHDAVAHDPELNKRLKQTILDTYGKFNLDELFGTYVDRYSWGSMSEEDILEEIFADAYAGMNVLGYSAYTAAERYTELVNEEVKNSKRENKTNARGAKYSIEPTLSKQLDDVLNRTFKENSEVKIGTTSDFLHNVIGLDVLSVLMPPQKAYAAMVSEEQARKEVRDSSKYNYHNLGKEGLINALVASENPIFAYTEGGRRIILVTGLFDNNHEPIVVVADVDSQGTYDSKVIRADKDITVYGREQVYDNIVYAAKHGQLLYADKKRSHSFFEDGKTQFPVILNNVDFQANINTFLGNVNWEKYKESNKHSEEAFDRDFKTLDNGNLKVNDWKNASDEVWENLLKAYRSQGAAFKNAEEAKKWYLKYGIIGKGAAEELRKIYGVIADTQSESDTKYLDAVKSNDMETAQRMVDEAAERAGYTYNGYHGRLAEFNVFDRSYENIENDMGKGFYFTSNESDADENYASESGADRENRLNQLVEFIMEREEVDEDEAKEIAKEQLGFSEDNANILNARLKIENPVRLTNNSEGTFFDYEENYDEENDEYGEPSGTLVDFIEALQSVEDEFESWRSPDYWGILGERMYDDGGIYAVDAIKFLKDNILNEVTDEEGRLAVNELIRRAFEEMGYDAIIDETVSYKFRNMLNMTPGTTHYIVFNPNQIKNAAAVTYDNNGNAIPLSKRFNANSDDIRYSEEINAKYLELAKNPKANETELRRMVDEAAKAAGYPIKAYHGTPFGGYTVYDFNKNSLVSGFGRGVISLTDNKNVASSYTGGNAETRNNINASKIEEELVSAFNKMFVDMDADVERELSNLLFYGEDIGAWDASAISDTIYDYYSIPNDSSEYDSYDEYLKARTKAEINAYKDYLLNELNNALAEATVSKSIIKQAIKDVKSVSMGYGKPTVYEWYIPNPETEYTANNQSEFDKYADMAANDGSNVSVLHLKGEGNRYYVKSNNLIKSADPVTYDDNGNIIPLSERFNTNSRDIRYSEEINSKEDFALKGQIGWDFTSKYSPNQQGFLDTLKETLDNRADGHFSADYFARFYAEYPEMDFVHRLYKKDATVKADLQEFLDKIDDVQTIENISWYSSQSYNWWMKQDYAGAVRSFRNLCKKRIQTIGVEKAIGRNLGIKGKISYGELKNLFYELNSNDEVKSIADRVFKVADDLGIEVHINNQLMGSKKANGVDLGRYVQIRESYLNDATQTDQIKAETILHEMIHACTAHAFHAYRNANGLNRNMLTSDMIKAVETLNAVYRQIVNDDDFKGEYAVKGKHDDATEMIAELANTRFREKLQKKNLLQRVLDAIKGFFGITSKTKTAYEVADNVLQFMLDDLVSSDDNKYVYDVENEGALDYLNMRGYKYSEEIVRMSDLQKANESLKAELAETRQTLKNRTLQKEYWKEEAHASKGVRLTDKGVKTLTEDFLTGWDSTVKARDIQGDVKEFAEYVLNNKKATYEDIKDRAVAIAQNVIENAQVLVSEDEDLYKEIKGSLSRGLKVPAYTPGEFGDKESWNKFLRQTRFVLNIRKNGADVDQVYQELSMVAPAYFPEDITGAKEQLEQILGTLQSLQPIYENPYNYNMAETIEYCANDLIKAVTDTTLPQKPPTRLDKERARGKAALDREKQKREKAVQKVKDYYKEKDNKKYVRKYEADLRNRLLKVAQRLKRIKTTEANRALINELIGELDTVSVSITGKTVNDLVQLRTWYLDEQENNPDDFIADPNIEKRLERLSKKQIKDLDLEDVRDLLESLQNIEANIRNSKKLIDSEDRRDAYLQAQSSMDDIRDSEGIMDKSELRQFMFKFETVQALSPERFIRRITGYNENSPLYMATKALSEGQRNMMDYQRRANKMFAEWINNEKFTNTLKGKKAKTVKITGTANNQDVTVEINRDMLLSLVMHSYNDQNLKHIQTGGIRIPNLDALNRGKADAYSKGTTIRLTPSAVRGLRAELTDAERDFCKRARDYFDNVSTAEINAVSEKLVGYSLAQVENYFPITTDPAFLSKEFDSIKNDGTIEGMGFLKERINAGNAIMLRGLTNVLNQSIDMNSKYVGLAIPVRNFNKLWRLSTNKYFEDGSVEHGSDSLENAVREQYGDEAVKYIGKMLTDIQNGRGASDVMSRMFNKLRSNYAGAVLSLNLSVAIKQAASYPTAAAVVGWDALAKGLAQGAKDRVSGRKFDKERVAELTPVLWYRSLGFSTTELGDVQKNENAVSKILNKEWLNWIQAIDIGTTQTLFRAAEFYVEDTMGIKKGSTEFDDAVTDVYNRIIEETQPNYSTMQRPQLLRTESDIVRNTLAMFKTQPLQNMNILYDALGNQRAKKIALTNATEERRAFAKKEYDEATKNASRAIVSQIVQLATFAAMTALWNIIRHRKDRYEGEKGLTFFSALGTYLKDMLSGAAGMFVGGTEAYNMFAKVAFGDTYYAPEVASLGMVGDLFKDGVSAFSEIGKGIEAINDDDEDTKFDFKNTADKFGTFFESISKLGGIPLENIHNLYDAAAQTVMNIALGKYEGTYQFYKQTKSPNNSYYKSDYYDLLYKAKQKDQKAYEKIKSDMIKSGAFKENNIDSAMKKRAEKSKK